MKIAGPNVDGVRHLTIIGPLRSSPAPPDAPGAARRRLRMMVTEGTAAAMLLAGAGTAPAAASAILQLQCTNAASGASWPVTVDLDFGRVDSLPATVTKRWISWRDPKVGFFDLERATGKLQLRNASSTGGYFLHYQCRQD